MSDHHSSTHDRLDELEQLMLNVLAHVRHDQPKGEAVFASESTPTLVEEDREENQMVRDEQ
jgi:hypothetical protein